MSRDRQIPLDQAFIPGKTLVYGEGNTVWNGGNGPDVITDSNVVWVDVSTNSSAVIMGTDNNCVEVAIFMDIVALPIMYLVQKKV